MIWQTIYLDKRFRLLKSLQRKQPTAIRERCFGLLIQIYTLGNWVNPRAIKKPVTRRFSLSRSDSESFPKVFPWAENSKKPDAVGVFLISVLLYKHHQTFVARGNTPAKRGSSKNLFIITSQISNGTFYLTIKKMI